MSTQVIIPVKRLDRALRRLRRVLSHPERAQMQEAMLRDMLDACTQCPAVSSILVVTNDATARTCAAEAGAHSIPDHDPPRGINGAVARGQRATAQAGHRALVLTADLPLVTPDDIALVAGNATTAPEVLLVPSHAGTGTNALLMDHASVIATKLGPNSRARHRAIVAEKNVTYRELHNDHIGLDIDTPEDLRRFIGYARPGRTLDVCHQLHLADRLVTELA